MGLESVTFISDLVSTNPVSTDLKSAGDDHIRRIKSALLNTFPLVTGAVSATHMELNALVGVTDFVQDQLDAKATISTTGVNSDITELTGLTEPLSVSQGGTGVTATEDIYTALGLLFRDTQAITTNYTVTTADIGILFNCTDEATITLPNAVTATEGFTLAFANMSDSNVTLDPGPDRISGLNHLIIRPRQSCILACDGDNWHQFGWGAQVEYFILHSSGGVGETHFTFTIPTDTYEMELFFDGVQLASAASIIVQLAGVTSGYAGAVGNSANEGAFSDGFKIRVGNSGASEIHCGNMKINRVFHNEGAAETLWVESGVTALTNVVSAFNHAGRVDIPPGGSVTSVVVTTSAGGVNFDAGSIILRYKTSVMLF